MLRKLFTSPLALALVVTLANAVKPVVVDDTAYLMYARQITQHPLDPYGFEAFWYARPYPAMEVLCPPVVPYWLALGIGLFGESVPLLKLWMLPFVWLLAWSLRALLARFARGSEPVALPLLVLSPAILPTVNLMLDIPTVALGLAAVMLFVRGSDRGGWLPALMSGLLAGLAMQAKYTGLLVPPLIAWYGLTHRRLGPAAVAVGVAAAVFAGCELLLVAKYGQSHFLYHLQAQKPAGQGEGLAAFLRAKYELGPGLAGHLGFLAAGVGLYAAAALGVSRRVLVAAAGLWVVGAGLVAVLPGHTAVLVPRKLTLPTLVWRVAGFADLIVGAACLLVLLVRFRVNGKWRPGVRTCPDSLFVIGWVLLEVAGYFALTPFPAGRRVIGLTLALGVLAARVASRTGRIRATLRPPRWVLAFGVTAGLLLAALDTFDAFPEKALAEHAAAAVREKDPTATVWYCGHWGFQYYCERAGMKPYVPGSRLAPGDYIVFPLFPGDKGFYRPDSQNTPEPPVGWVMERVGVFTWDDPLPAQTIPNFYGGEEPVIGRDHPRLRVAVERVIRPWAGRAAIP